MHFQNIVDIKFLDISATEQGYIAEDSSGFYLLSRQGQFLQQKALEAWTAAYPLYIL